MEYPSPDYSATSNAPISGASADPRPQSRIASSIRHPQATTALLAILIGFASVLSAVIAWRASVASIEASRYQSLSVQQQARIQQIERQLEGLIAQDLRFVNVYQEHALAARELTRQADSLRASDAAAADSLDLQAEQQLDLARSVEPFFLGAGGVSLGDDGTVTYDEGYVMRNLSDGDPELRELRTQRTAELAERADARSLSLVGVGALMVTALFFLTIAQVTRRRDVIRQAFFVAGAVLVAVGALGFVIIEIIA